MAALLDRSRWSRWFKTARHPPKYLIASLLVSLGGLLNGLDTSTIGPVIVMPSFTESFGTLSSSMEGFVVSSLLIPATITALFAGAVSDSLGRTRALAIGALLFAIGAAFEAGAVHLAMLILGRCIVGIGEGLFLSAMIVYVCEIAPPKHRGPLVTTIQLFITMGLCLGFFTTYGTVTIPSSLSWRLPLALHSAIAFVLMIASTFYLPESPRWLSYKGRKQEASKAWDTLGVSGAEREKDLLLNSAGSGPTGEPVEAVVSTHPAVPKKTLRSRMRGNYEDIAAIFKKDVRKPTLLGIFLMSMQQLSGIDGVIYYAPLLFQQAGLSSSEASFLASGVSAICIFVFTILSVIFVDRWGRRPSTIYGGLILSICMAVMGILYASKNVHPTSGIGRWIVILMIYIFAIVYSMTWAIGVKLLASEIQPVATRATAQSIGQSANCISNFFVAFITPVLLSSSSSAFYFLFGGAVMVTLGVSTMYMPETKGRDLETIGEAFAMHSASEMPLVIGFKRLVSRFAKVAGIGHEARGSGSGSNEQHIALETLTS